MKHGTPSRANRGPKNLGRSANCESFKKKCYPAFNHGRLGAEDMRRKQKRTRSGIRDYGRPQYTAFKGCEPRQNIQQFVDLTIRN